MKRAKILRKIVFLGLVGTWAALVASASAAAVPVGANSAK
jgi:hypothetical protein